MEQVSVTLNALDLYAPKFGLDDLGVKGEKIILRVVLSRDSGLTNLYGTYKIGSRHAQISAEGLGEFGSVASVASVGRCDLRSAISEINSSQPDPNLVLSLVGNNLLVDIESKRFSAVLERMYTIGGKLFLLVQLLGKRLKIGFDGKHVRLYDSSNRRVAGLAVVGNRLIIKRKFQHPELAAA